MWHACYMDDKIVCDCSMNSARSMSAGSVRRRTKLGFAISYIRLYRQLRSTVEQGVDSAEGSSIMLLSGLRFLRIAHTDLLVYLLHPF